MFSHFLRLLLLRFRKYEVENHADDGREPDAGNGEGTGGEDGTTQAHRQHHRDCLLYTSDAADDTPV